MFSPRRRAFRMTSSEKWEVMDQAVQVWSRCARRDKSSEDPSFHLLLQHWRHLKQTLLCADSGKDFPTLQLHSTICETNLVSMWTSNHVIRNFRFRSVQPEAIGGTTWRRNTWRLSHTSHASQWPLLIILTEASFQLDRFLPSTPQHRTAPVPNDKVFPAVDPAEANPICRTSPYLGSFSPPPRCPGLVDTNSTSQ